LINVTAKGLNLELVKIQDFDTKITNPISYSDGTTLYIKYGDSWFSIDIANKSIEREKDGEEIDLLAMKWLICEKIRKKGEHYIKLGEREIIPRVAVGKVELKGEGKEILKKVKEELMNNIKRATDSILKLDERVTKEKEENAVNYKKQENIIKENEKNSQLIYQYIIKQNEELVEKVDEQSKAIELLKKGATGVSTKIVEKLKGKKV